MLKQLYSIKSECKTSRKVAGLFFMTNKIEVMYIGK